jgi:hypothetical protein
MGLLKGKKQAVIHARESVPEKNRFLGLNHGVQYASSRLRSYFPMIRFIENKGRRVKPWLINKKNIKK